MRNWDFFTQEVPENGTSFYKNRKNGLLIRG